MNLLVLFSALSSTGGIERYNSTLLQHFEYSGVGKTVFSFNDTSSENVVGFNRNLLSFFLKTFIQGFKSNTVLIGHRNFLPLLILPSLWFKRKILIAHGIEVWEQQAFHYRFFAKFIDEVWAVSSFTAKKVKENFGTSLPVHLIPNTLPTKFNPLPLEQILKKQKVLNTIRFLSVSRVAKEENYKNIDICIQAVKNWSEGVQTNWVYDLVIHGNDKERHLEIAGNDRRFQFHGFVSDQELINLYTDSQIFLLPSSGEGFGIVYLEAMAMGCICVAADTGGATDFIINNENGMLCHMPVTVQDIESILTRLESREFSTLLVSNGIKVAEKYSFQSVNKIITRVLEAKPK
ncbi:MAG: glycosyltransferase family 4 protein [Bacteroidetes bacterium]|nr:glycosyltransferase family 4 protein [Bacteroidota bacterium]